MHDSADTPRGYRLPRSARLGRKRDYDRVFDARCSAADDRLVVYAAANGLGLRRLGVAVSARIRPAAARSRCRRMIREAFRLQQHDLPPGYDYIVLPRGPGRGRLDELRGSLQRLSERAVRKFARKADTDAARGPDEGD